MATRRLSIAGLLLLSQPSQGLRGIDSHSHREEPPSSHAESSGPAGTSFSRQSTADRKTRTMGHLMEEIRQRIPDPVPVVGAELGAWFDGARDCRMNQSSCRLADLQQGHIANIYPGGSTRCLFGSEFLFRVWAGDSDKLMIHLDGGGACWDEMTTVQMTTCMPECILRPMYGAFNTCPGKNKTENPFRHYTVVFVNHCSGDMHGGNVSHPWKHPAHPNVTVEQRGLVNFRSVLDWAKANMAPKLQHLVFTGESAGAIGMKVWAPTLLREFHYDSAAVLADSYVGVFPDGFQGSVFQNIGVCDSGLLPAEHAEKCRQGVLSIPEVYDAAIKEFPNVLFGNINSKHDATQVMFYNVALGSVRVMKAKAYCGPVDAYECDLSDAPPEVTMERDPLEGPEYHKRMEEVIELYSRNPNYVSYLLSGESHCLLSSSFGDCPYIDYNHMDGCSWLGGRDGPQRWSVGNWTSHFFAASRGMRSACERFLSQNDDDDYCREVQELHQAV